MRWTKEHKRFVGRVIFANFLKIPLWKYRNIIKEVEDELYFRKGRSVGVTAVKTKKSSKVVAEIIKDKNGFGIRYVYEGFNRIYITSGLEHSALFYKLRRINSRNELTHRIIKAVIERQKRYLETGNPIDLAPFSQRQLADRLNFSLRSAVSGLWSVVCGLSSEVDNSWTSRLVSRISVITPWGEERILRAFFQTRKDVNKRLIKTLFDKESEDLQSGRLKRPYTDNELRTLLETLRTTKQSLSRHTIGACRRQMGIPIASRRLLGYKYPPLSANFSLVYPLTMESVSKYAPQASGIYELSAKNNLRTMNYELRTNVFYIGSARNLRKRIKEHLRANNKNGHIEERKLYELFAATYGKPPKCNRVSPVGN